MVNQVKDLKSFKVNKLRREYCVDKLMENLAVEQPGRFDKNLNITEKLPC